MKLQNQHKELIERYLTGEEQLAPEVKALLEEKEGQAYYNEIQKLLGRVDRLPLFDEKEGWKKFAHWIDKRQKVKRMVTVSQQIFRYAAVILIAVLFGYSLQWLNQPMDKEATLMTWSVPRGQVGTFTFSDGTQVTMNAGSSLTFSDWRDSKERRVQLTGEAFFKVAHDESKPFFVEGGSQEIKVYGTQFNVMAYPEDPYVRTTLVEGLVSLTVAGNEKEHFLKPGQQITLQKAEKKMIRQKVRTDDVTLWMEGRLKFEDMPLKELIRHIERVYDVHVSLDDADLGDELFTGSFTKKEGVERLLRLLEGASFGMVQGEKKGEVIRLFRGTGRISGLIQGPRSMI